MIEFRKTGYGYDCFRGEQFIATARKEWTHDNIAGSSAYYRYEISIPLQEEKIDVHAPTIKSLKEKVEKVLLS
jgi:hypothetical protein